MNSRLSFLVVASQLADALLADAPALKKVYCLRIAVGVLIVAILLYQQWTTQDADVIASSNCVCVHYDTSLFSEETSDGKRRLCQIVIDRSVSLDHTNPNYNVFSCLS